VSLCLSRFIPHNPLSIHTHFLVHLIETREDGEWRKAEFSIPLRGRLTFCDSSMRERIRAGTNPVTRIGIRAGRDRRFSGSVNSRRRGDHCSKIGDRDAATADSMGGTIRVVCAAAGEAVSRASEINSTVQWIVDEVESVMRRNV
jgi:hypothetical protein